MIGKAFRKFAKLEASAGIVLFICAFFAVILDNSPWHDAYISFFYSPLHLRFAHFEMAQPLLLWINDGLMVLFFLLIALEIKREMLEGELNSMSKAMLPAIAALGGMVVPALIYLGFNYSDWNALAGWAIPTATDIAFSLAILSLLGKKLPSGLKIFLMALAIFDDIGAIIIIAVFYTNHISHLMLLVAGFLTGLLFLLNRLGVTRYWPYLLLGIILWFCVLKSGVHATLAGIVLAFALPFPNAKKLINYLHPWVAFGVLPLFAFANAGFSFQELSLAEILAPLPLGIALGLFFGKQVGISGATFLAVRSRWAELPHGVSKLGVYGVSLVAGVGFTMSLFIGSLAFGYQEGSHFNQVRLGVLAGSLISGLTGFLLLRYIYRKER